MKSKNNIESDQDRAVSPVIGVILMVAITVILAAVIAAFVLDLGQGQTANPQAGFDIDDSGSNVEVRLMDVTRLDAWGVTCDGTGADTVLTSGADTRLSEDVGTSATEGNSEFDGSCGNGAEDVTIYGEYNGNRVILQS